MQTRASTVEPDSKAIGGHRISNSIEVRRLCYEVLVLQALGAIALLVYLKSNFLLPSHSPAISLLIATAGVVLSGLTIGGIRLEILALGLTTTSNSLLREHLPQFAMLAFILFTLVSLVVFILASAYPKADLDQRARRIYGIAAGLIYGEIALCLFAVASFIWFVISWGNSWNFG